MEEEKEPFADTASGVATVYFVLTSSNGRDDSPHENERAAFLQQALFVALILLTFYRAFNSSKDVF